MPVTMKTPYQWQIKFKGIFDYSGLLSMITDWMVSKSFETHQKKDKHKTRPTGGETEFKIFGWRNLTEFIKWTITIEVWGWDQNDVEVVKNGEKKKMQRGRLWIRLNSEIIADRTARFDKDHLTVTLRKFLLDKVLLHRLDSIESDMLHYRVAELQTEIKRFLGMSTTANEFADLWARG
jgi:hypothetical protein